MEKDKPKYKVLIATPTASPMVYLEYMRSLLKLNTDNIDIDYCFSTHTITSAARNLAVIKLLADKSFTHLFFIDSDQTFPANTLQRLLSHNVDIVSALYRTRKCLGQYMAFILNTDGNFFYHVENIMLGRGLYECDAVPTGVLLIKREVFETTPQPHFWYDDKIQLNNDFLKKMVEHDPEWTIDPTRLQYGYGNGEDLNFCLLAKQHGYHVYVDTDIICGHLGTQELGHAEIIFEPEPKQEGETNDD